MKTEIRKEKKDMIFKRQVELNQKITEEIKIYSKDWSNDLFIESVDKKMVLKSIIDKKMLDKVFTPYLFVFSSYLFGKLSKTRSNVIACSLYLMELILMLKVRKPSDYKAYISSYEKILENLILEKLTLKAEAKLEIIKIIKKIITGKPKLNVPMLLEDHQENLSREMTIYFSAPIFAVFKIGSYFQNKTEDDIRMLKGFSDNIARLMYIDQASHEYIADFKKKMFMDFDLIKIEYFSEQAILFLKNFDEDKRKFLEELVKFLTEKVREDFRKFNIAA